MAGRHLLTFELAEEGDELSIYGDAPGLRLLAERVLALAQKAETQSQPTIEQLSTSVWGGNELSLEPQGTETRLIYQVRIVAQPKRK
jgi:hypothetical protein